MDTRRMLVRLTSLIAVLVLAVGAGCGSGSGGGSSSSGGGTPSSAKPGSGIKIGLVTDIGGLNDRGFNELAANAVNKAHDELGVDIKILESKSDADYIPNLSQLGDEGYDLIVSNGYLMGDQTHQAAEAYPDSSFMIIDYAYEEKDALPNLLGVVFKEQEAGYLVGYMAGLMTKSGTVSTVGGQAIPPVDHFIGGFQQGATDAKPDVKLLNGYSNEFPDPAPCKEIALDQISKQSDIVFAVAGQCGLGALDAAKEKTVWGIGVDKDQLFLGDHIMTSAVKKVDEGVYQTIQQVVDGTFAGGVTALGLKEKGVGLGQVNPKVPQDVVDKVNALIPKIISGEIQVSDTPKVK